WWIPIGLLLVGSVYFWNQSHVDKTNTIAGNEKIQLLESEKKSGTSKQGLKESELKGLNFNSNQENSNEEKNSAPLKNSNRLRINANILKFNSNTTDRSIKTNEPLNNSVSGVLPAGKDLENSSPENISNIGLNKNFNESIKADFVEESLKSSTLKFFPDKKFSLNEIRSSIPLKDYQLSTPSPAKSILRNWSYGVNVAAGVAGIYDRNLIRQTDASARSSTAFLPANLSGIVYRTEVVQPGVFYAIGGFIERPVGKLFNLSAGLNYTRYNTKVNVGAKISRSTTIFPGTQDNQDVSFYYSPDPKGTYQMHHSMIEIPVTVRFSYRSVSANAGVSGSTLVSSDMLAFDARSGVYYKERDKMNRFQFGLTGGFDVAVLKKAKYPLYIGPVFRYQVSDITSRYTDSRHLVSAALQARFYLQR
ncbi:MAG: outer membrane beta-barrel protein, partial [Flavitalea sp.]